MASFDIASFPAVDVDKELHPRHNQKVEVDSVSSDIAASKEIKAQAERDKREKERQKRDAMQKVESAIMGSAVIVVVAGAAFAITKKLREK